MEPPQNPYAPPVETPDEPGAHVPQTPSMALSEKDWAMVTSLAKWMRVVATFLAVFAVLAGLGSLGALCSGAATKGGLVGGSISAAMLTVTVLVILAAVWLRQAAHHFYDGVLSNAEHALARGFRKLRLFMILYGIWCLLQLATTITTFVGRGA